MRGKRLALHLLFYLLHRRSLDLDRSIVMSPSHFQETTRDHVENMAVCLRVTYLAPLAIRLHVSCQCYRRLEHLETFQTTIVRSLMAARGQMVPQIGQVIECVSDIISDCQMVQELDGL